MGKTKRKKQIEKREKIIKEVAGGELKNQKHAKQSFSSVCSELETKLGLVYIRKN